MDMEEFSEKYLFKPLGIEHFDWSDRFPDGLVECASGLKLTPRSMVKIGATVLNDGIWNGQSIIPKQWVEKSAVPFSGNVGIKVPQEDIGKAGYSYTWWTKELSVAGKKIQGFSASGWGGQKILVITEINTVIVFTGGNYTSTVNNFKILEKYIIPSMN
jgi:CubicO group peptidase (beta-lactamase class C family)